jgi:hypothetical protein
MEFFLSFPGVLILIPKAGLAGKQCWLGGRDESSGEEMETM